MSFKVSLGRSQKKDITEAAQEAVSSCLARIDPREIDLAVLFTTAEFAVPALLKKIKSALRTELPVIGCSGMGLISSYGLQKEGMVLMLISGSKVKIASGAIEASPSADEYLSAQELANNLLFPIKGMRRETGLLFTSGLFPSSSHSLKGLQNILGTSFPFIGGEINYGPKPRPGALYYNQTVIGKGLVSALFAGKLNYGIGVRHGWKPLGKIRIVTESSGNIIKKIDAKPAAGVYQDYFAKTTEELKKELPHINTLYPIGIRIKGETEYLLRNVTSFTEDGGLITQGDIPQGSPVRLMICTKESCLEASRQAALQAKSALKNKTLDFALVISSASRYHLLGRDAGSEVKIIQETLGEDIPLIGFYGYGELAPLGGVSYYGQTYFHNQTVAILGMGE